ncbi:MAG: penicillin-binding protein 2 [Elusimicrobia bacterium]|nr:penicillin-binding protein 2 [Elusimicrobiota bacterium]
MTAKTLKTRIKFCAYIAVLPALPVSARLFYLQTISHENLTAAASREFNRTVSETGPRGRIFDSSGSLLAQSIVTWDCFLFKNELENPARALEELSAALDIKPSQLRDKYRREKNFVVVKRGLDRTACEKIKALELKGVTLEMTQTRYYPSGELARNVLGIVGANTGLTGVELLYDKVLSGLVSRRGVIKDASGRVIYENKEGGEEHPRDIYLTLDKNIQFFTQEAVKKEVLKNRADLGMGLVQDPNTGKILAMATYPENPVKLPPVEWVYEPGSTFKSITLSAALEKNVVSERDTFFCEKGAWQFNKQVIIHDHEPEGTLTLSGVIERSSNIGAAKIGLKLGIENYYLYAKAFGFGTKPGLGFYGESAGILRAQAKYRQIDLAVGSYGHGLAATPLQVISAYSALANGGRLLEARLVDKITDFDGKEISREEPSTVRRAVSEETARRVKAILLAVVDKGTGVNAAVAGYRVAGKTGTSKKIDPKTGKYLTGSNVASFCGFFPADKPMYTILVVMDNPKTSQYGGESAAPAFQEISKKIITMKGIKPDVPEQFKNTLKTSVGPISD